MLDSVTRRHAGRSSEVSSGSHTHAGIRRLWWTNERALYALFILVGLGLRVWRLDAAPLSPWEAANSWPAWLAAQGLPMAHGAAPTSALGYGLQWFVFWLGGGNDFGARLVPLLAGTAVIVLPWWLRAFIGRATALVIALLVALDPWLIQFSRLADGSMVAVALGLAVLVLGVLLVLRPPTTNRETLVRLGTVGLGLLLVSGPMGLNMLPVIGMAGWLWRRELGEAGVFERRRWAWVGAAALLGGTLGLVRLDGLAWVTTSVTIWFSQLDGRDPGGMIAHITGQYGLGWPWLRLIVDGPMTAAVGVAGLAVLARTVAISWTRDQTADEDSHAGRVALLLLAWSAWGVLLWILPGRSPLALPMLGLPLTLAAGPWLVRLAVKHPRELDTRELAAVVVTLLILVTSVSIWAASLLHRQELDLDQVRLVLIALGLGLLIVVAFAYWARPEVALWLVALVVVGLLLTVNLRAAWHLKQENDTSRAGWQALTTHSDVRNMVDDVKALSLQRTGDSTEMHVQVQLAPIVDASGRTIPARPDPVLGWYLRDMRNLSWVVAPMVDGSGQDATPGPLVVLHEIGEGGAASALTAAAYVGSVFRLESYWLPTYLFAGERGDEDALRWWWRQMVRPWGRWVIYREVGGDAPTRTVALWASGVEGR